MINRLIIHNFKCIKDADINISERNIIVGNNGAGKSTLMEALSLAMGYGLSKLEITPYLFHVDCIKKFIEDKIPPEITVEIIFDGNDDIFSGTNNSLHENLSGLRLKIYFDEEFGEQFEDEKETCTQIPCEYYKIERHWFSDKQVTQQSMPFNILLIDSVSKYFNGSINKDMAYLLKRYIGIDDMIKVQSSLRHLRENFEGDEEIGEINRKLDEEIEKLKVSIDVTSNIISRNILSPFYEGIPVKQIGDGNLCILKTMLSFTKSRINDKSKVIIIEEPETHLSHTKMHEMIEIIEERLEDTNTQLILTTHNSFIANKLNLSNVIIIENNSGTINTCQLSNITDDCKSFFAKISNYPTLRLVLCKSAILVEGPTDEIIVTYHYYKVYNKHPFNDGIELISLGGLAFKWYVELAKILKKKIAIITDNDGLNENELQEKRGLQNLPEKIKIFTEQNVNLKTLEPSFVAINETKLQKISDIIRKQKRDSDTKEELIKFMTNNKTEWAYRVLATKDDDFECEVPDYIKNAINWLRDSNE